MANYSRDKMKKEGDASVGLGVGLALGLAGAVAGGVASHNNKKKQEQDRQEQIALCNSKISDIDNKIANLRSQLFGNTLNADEISRLQESRRQLVDLRNKFLNS